MESLVLPGLAVVIIIATIILSRMDAKTQRELEAEAEADRPKPTSDHR